MRSLLLIAALLTFTSAYGSSVFPLAYFKEIALGTEFPGAESNPYVRLWTEDIKVYVHGKGSLKLNNELDNVINELNGLTSTIDISKVTSKEQANFEVYFGSAESYSKTESVATGWASNAKKRLAKNHGLFLCSMSKNAITKCTSYVDTERASPKGQLHLLREEFTQALGLMKDSPAYPDSIFYGKESYTAQYSATDIQLIKFLYSGLVTPGMSGIDIESLLQGITPLKALTQRDGLVYKKNFPALPFTGEALSHFDSNRVNDQRNYQGGKLHGTQRQFYNSGELKNSSNFVAGVRDGVLENFFESGQLKDSGNFSAGKREGQMKAYYESGQLKVDDNFSAGKREGLVKAYYESGQLRVHSNYSQDSLHGVILQYTIDGNKKGKWEYKTGVKHGLEENYYENGAIKARLNWEDGVNHGSMETYNKNGVLKSRSNYKNGKREGTKESYHENGKLEYKFNYKNDKLEGIADIYHENGNLKGRARYEDGVPVGQSETYDLNGK